MSDTKYLRRPGQLLKTSGASLALACAWVSAVQAQDAAQPAPSPSATAEPASAAAVAGTNDIIVTAQRRSESLQRVPISVQVVSDRLLARAAVTDTVSLTQIAPSLTFTGGSAAAQTSFSLRGVSSQSFAAGVQSSTTLVIDGVPVVRQAEFISELSDIDRIEVLNGPQGTLFGKNSTAGIINVVTKRPVDHFEGWVEGGASTDDEFAVKAMVNAPLTDNVILRVNGFYSDQSPQVKNLTGPDIDGAKKWGIQAKLAFKLSDKVNFLLSSGYSRINSSYSGFILDIPRNALQLQAIGYTPGGKNPVINQDARTIDILKAFNVSGELNVEFNDKLSLTSVTSYRRFQALSDNDNDLTPAGVLLGFGFTPNPFNYPLRRIGTTPKRYRDFAYYFSEETRFNYASGPINAVAGVFYQNLRNPYYNDNPQVVNSEFVGRPAGQ